MFKQKKNLMSNLIYFISDSSYDIWYHIENLISYL